MKRIEATRKTVIRDVESFYAKEITSFEQLYKLKHNKEVAVMSNCDMVIGEIMYKEKDWVLINVVTGTVTVKPDSFKYGNFMYEIVCQD